jgi:hypothetical protein
VSRESREKEKGKGKEKIQEEEKDEEASFYVDVPEFPESEGKKNDSDSYCDDTSNDEKVKELKRKYKGED